MRQLREAGPRHCSCPGRFSMETPPGPDPTERHALRLWPARVHLHSPLRGMETPQTVWVSLTSIVPGSFVNVGRRNWPLDRQMTDPWRDRSPWAHYSCFIPAHQYLVSSLIPEDHPQERAALMSALCQCCIAHCLLVDAKSYHVTPGASSGFKD